MSNDIDKIYCMDHSNNDALAYLAGQSRNSDPMAMAAMMNGGMGNQWNNPFIYLVWMMFANRFWNNGSDSQNADLSRQLQTLQSTVADNHNNDLALQAINGNRDALGQLAQTFNTSLGNISSAVCAVRSAIEQVGGQVGYSAESVKNAIALGDANIVSKMQDCCCQNKQLVVEQGYQNQLATERQTNAITSQMSNQHSADMLQDANYHSALLSRIDQLANGVTQGFAQVGYQAEKNTSAIIQANNANTQRILDQMCANQTQILRDTIADKDRQLQTQTIINQLSGNNCNCNS